MYYYNVSKICDLIQFSKEKISKEILLHDNDKMAILFALKEKQEVSEHFSNTDAIIFVLKGKVKFILTEEKNEYIIEEKQMLKLKAFDKHSIIALEDSIFIVVRL